MSRIDKLLSLVESLDQRSDMILSSYQQTNELINKIDALNDRLSTFDMKINDSNNLVLKNFEFLHNFNDLLTRTNYFETNLHSNDDLTNQNILNNIDSEFRYLKMKHGHDTNHSHKWDFNFHHINDTSNGNTNGSNSLKNSPMRPGLKLKPSISISNLTLKPIKCKPNKIYKKKSHYRISNVFNNPVVSPVIEQSSSFEDPVRHDEITQSIGYEYPDIGVEPQINNESHALVEPKTEVPNVVSQEKDPNENILTQQNLDDYIQGMEQQHQHPQSKAQLPSRLQVQAIQDQSKSHISSDSLGFDKTDTDTPDTFSSDNLMDEIFDINSEPIIKPTNFEFDVFDDNESTILSDSHFENFENFLRKSRINLNQGSYPYILKTTTSESSLNGNNSREGEGTDIFDGVVIKNEHVGSNPTECPFSPTPRRNNYHAIESEFGSEGLDSDKFHNPIDNIKLSNKSVTPTMESIYFTTSSSDSKSKTLLNKVINNTPKKRSTTAFSFLNSLMDDEGHRKEAPRRKSISGSFTDTFFSLMVTESPKKIQGINKLNLTSNNHCDGSNCKVLKRKRRINKLDEMKNVPKTHPITITNDMQIKRLPPSITALSPKSISTKKLSISSNLVINSNKSFIIHGDSSIFNTPIISNFSNRSLQDALASSLSY